MFVVIELITPFWDRVSQSKDLITTLIYFIERCVDDEM